MATGTKDQLLGLYFGEVEKTLGDLVRKALAQIERSRRNLAIRGYVKFSSRVAERWAWTKDEEDAFKKTATFQTLARESEDIKLEFKTRNPGFHLGINQDQVRSLETQIRFWNRNESVLGLGQDLDNKAFSELQKPVYTNPPSPQSVKAFKTWLPGVRLSWTTIVKGKPVTYRSPTHATPGLSSHGRLRALDFLVFQDEG